MGTLIESWLLSPEPVQVAVIRDGSSLTAGGVLRCAAFWPWNSRSPSRDRNSSLLKRSSSSFGTAEAFFSVLKKVKYEPSQPNDLVPLAKYFHVHF